MIWAFRLRRRAFRSKSAVVCRGAHSRGQELPPVALPLLSPSGLRLCGLSATIANAKQQIKVLSD